MRLDSKNYCNFFYNRNIKINDIDKSDYLRDTKNSSIMLLDHDHQPAKMGNLSNDHDMQNILVEARARLSNIKGIIK